MTTQNVTIPALSGGSFSAYVAVPSTQPSAGIVLARDRTLAFLKQHLGSAVIQGVTS